MGEGIFSLILVPVDGSRQSLAAVEAALEAAKGCGGDVEALHVIDEQVIADLAKFGSSSRPRVEQELEENGRSYLRAVEEMATSYGVPCRTALRTGVAYREIIAEVRERGATCILMARVGKRGPRRISIGTVTERVIEYADCPVLIMPEVDTRA